MILPADLRCIAFTGFGFLRSPGTGPEKNRSRASRHPTYARSQLQAGARPAPCPPPLPLPPPPPGGGVPAGTGARQRAGRVPGGRGNSKTHNLKKQKILGGKSVRCRSKHWVYGANYASICKTSFVDGTSGFENGPKRERGPQRKRGQWPGAGEVITGLQQCK